MDPISTNIAMIFCSFPVGLHFLNFFLQPTKPTKCNQQGKRRFPQPSLTSLCSIAKPTLSKQVNEEFAQKFVDLLCLHPTYMKPCVSFGQDNDLVYCTVPATSTQGAISAEDKAKQARGGVQLVRFSLLFKQCRAVYDIQTGQSVNIT